MPWLPFTFSMNIKCPNCGEQHALFWRAWADGQRKLFYRCNKIQKIKNHHHPWKEPLMKFFSGMIMVEDVFLIRQCKKQKDIPTQWTPGLARKTQEKQQLGLL